jgi:hypothetical protein
MGLILWPAALLVLLFWSLAAWIIFGLSDWAASQVAAGLGGILTAELGPWAAWIIGSLGTLIKIGIVAFWGIVSFGILGAPLWLRRQRRAGNIPESYMHDRSSRGSPAWRQRADQGYEEISFLRDQARERMGKYRRKKKGKRDDDDDDD